MSMINAYLLRIYAFQRNYGCPVRSHQWVLRYGATNSRTVTLRQELKKSGTEPPEGRVGIPVPNIGRAATSGTLQDQRAHRQVLEKVL